MNYYFEQEKDIADIDILIEIGNKMGLPDVDKFLNSNEMLDEMKKEMKNTRQRMARILVRGVPAYFITGNVNGQKLEKVLSGAKDSKKFTKIFDIMFEDDDD